MDSPNAQSFKDSNFDSQPIKNNTNTLASSIDQKSYLLSELTIQSDTLLFGLNFKYTKVIKKGIFNRLKGNTQTLDLDLSCILFDEALNVIDKVWFKQLRDSSQAIRHQGDSLNGKDRGDAPEIDRNVDVETIELRLSKLPLKISKIALLVSSYYGYPLKQIERGNIYISDDEGNEVFTSDLTLLDTDSSAMCIAFLNRELGEWRLTIEDLSLSSHEMDKMIKLVKHELSRDIA